jgi:transposase
MSKKETKMHQSSLVEKRVKEIKRRTRKKYNTEEKIRIVLEGLKGESSIAELCRREGINQNTYYRWSKDFIEAGGTTGTISTIRNLLRIKIWLAIIITSHISV